MKRLLLMLVALLGYMAPSFAQTVTTITLAEEEGLVTANNVASWGWNHDPFEFTVDQVEKGASTPKYVASGKDLRVYAANTMTIKAVDKTLTKIVFNISTQGLKRLPEITANVGEIAPQASGDQTVVWTGKASEVTLTVGSTAIYGTDSSAAGQFDFTSMELTTLDGATIPYTELEYIECTGGDRANAFTTDYLPNSNTTVKVGFQQTGTNGWVAIFCARDTHAGTGISLYVNGNNNAFLGFFTGGTRGDGDEFTAYENGARYDVVAHTTKLQWSKDGGEWQEKATGNTTMNATVNKLSFFANPDWDNALKGRIFYFGYEDNEVSYNFVPAMRHSDGKVGFWDKASNKFVLPAKGNYANYTWGKKEGETYLELNKTSLVMKKGDVETLVLTGAEGGNWTTSDAEVAVVENGVVTATGVGTCTVTCSVDDWNLNVDVEVIPNVVAVDAASILEWNGTDDAILPAIRYNGDDAKWAYTWVANSGISYVASDFNKIVGAPSADEAGNAWYAAGYEMTNDAVDTWKYNNTVLPSGWPTAMSDVYARRYFKAAGSLEGTTVYMAAPHDDSPCEYYINGTLVWSRTGFEACNGWYEAEVVRLTDEQKALIKTDGSVNVFAYHVHQNWGGRYADGGLYIGGEPKNLYESANDVNTRAYFENLLAMAEAVEGIDMGALAEARKHLNWRQDANDTWIIEDMICMEMRKVLSPRYEYAAASAEPADGLECWIYNVGTGQFLGGGNDWGTHTSVKAVPSSWPMVLHANTSGPNRYSIQTNLPNGIRGVNDWLGHNGYVDCAGIDLAAEGWAWTFEPVGDGSYRIINSQNSGENIYLGLTEGRLYQVDTDKAGADSPYNHWKLITKAQFEALYEAATEAAPANVSYKIAQNTFSQNDFAGNDKGAAGADLNDSKWERNAGSIWNWKSNNAEGDYCFEMWNTTGDVYLKQTVEGLLPGKYIVKCQGFYRDGNWDSAVAGNDARLAYLYAGTTENAVALKSILADAGKAPLAGRSHDTYVIPDGCKDAAKYFQYGLYTNEIEVTVGKDGVLELGIFRGAEGVKEQDWIVVDNFQLICVEAEALPSDFYLRKNGKWDGVQMALAADSEAAKKHFVWSGYLDSNSDKGYCFNFTLAEGHNGDECWGPADHKVIKAGEVEAIANDGDKVFSYEGKSGYVTINAYMTPQGTTVKVEDNTVQALKDTENLYIVGEKTTGWSRSSEVCQKLPKIADGVYEGTVTITRADAQYDAIRIVSVADNGDDDGFLGFNGEVNLGNGTYEMQTSKSSRCYMRKGDVKITVDVNAGTISTEYVEVAPTYFYAVGTLVDATWQNTDTRYKLTEVEPFVFKGTVKVAEDGDSRFSLFEERSSDNWNTGRRGPVVDKTEVAPGQVLAGVATGQDRAWRVPAGEWVVTLDLNENTFSYTYPELAVEVTYNEDSSVATVTAEPTKEGTSFIISIDGGEEWMELPEGGYQIAWLEAQAELPGVCVYNVVVREVIFDSEYNMTVVAEGTEQVHLSKPLPHIAYEITYSADYSSAVITAEPTEEGTELLISIDGGEEFMELPAEGYTVAWLESLADEYQKICIYNIVIREVKTTTEVDPETGEETVYTEIICEESDQVHLAKPFAPLYAAVGETTVDEEYVEAGYEFRLVDTKIQVEAYDDYVILKNFDGEDGYDLKVTFDEDKNATSIVVINGDKETDATAGWAKSGKANWYVYNSETYPCYAYSDLETESGYVFLNALVGDDWVYYYVAWGEAGVEVAELPFDYEYAEDNKSVTFTVTPTTEGSTILYFFGDDDDPAGMVENADNTFTVVAAPGQLDPLTHIAHIVVYIREYVFDGEDMVLVAQGGVEVDLLDPEAVGINNIAAELEAGKVYNVAGQRVSKAKNGVFIVNGKKVLVK